MLTDYSYFAPQVRNVRVYRCNSNGNEDDAGTYLRIYAERYYCNCNVYNPDPTAFNSCIIRYRYRMLPSGAFTNWVTILNADAEADWVNTGALVGTLSADESYEVEVGVLDALENENSTGIYLSASGVFLHKDGEMNSIGIGEAVGEKNTVSVAEKMSVKIKGKTHTKDVICDGVMTVGTITDGHLTDGGTQILKHGFDIFGTGGDSLVKTRLPEDPKTAATEPAYVQMAHAEVGQIGIVCQPSDNGEYNPGAVMMEMYNKYAGTSMMLGLVENRAMLTGLTEPTSSADAVNKQYVDTGLAGKAPDKYVATYTITSNSLSLDALIEQQYALTADQGMRNFMFNNTVSNAIAGGPWAVTIYRYNASHGRVELRHIYQGNKHKMHRFISSGSWGEWEWVNPPMALDTEYRTTERWNGKPVYRKLIEYTNPAAISGAMTLSIPHGIANLDMMLTANCTTSNYLLPYVTAGSSLGISAWNSTNLTMYGNSSWGAGRKWYIEMRYTKTTD